jgi:hypothetical protein
MIGTFSVPENRDVTKLKKRVKYQVTAALQELER